MKIGILTQPICENYGGIMQNYALQTVLLQMGHEVETLNWDIYRYYHEGETATKHFLQNAKTFVYKLFLKKHRNYNWEQRKLFYQLSANNQPFICQHLRLSNWLWGKEEFRNYTVKNHLNALIVGSDQVWRPGYNRYGMLLRMFLDFTSGLNIKRIAYAASFGVDVWEYDQEQTKKCSCLIQCFDAVSVREESAVKLCSQHLGYNHAELLLDPTLLLLPEEYEKLMLKNCPVGHKQLTTYILDNSEEKQHIIRSIAEHRQLQVVSYTPCYCDLRTVVPSAVSQYQYPSVMEWLQAIHDADCVVCDSFHGMVFSILFNKPFLAIGNRERGFDRFKSLLRELQLENRLVDYTCSVQDAIDVMNTSVNWEQVNRILQQMRLRSMNFLKRTLGDSMELQDSH